MATTEARWRGDEGGISLLSLDGQGLVGDAGAGLDRAVGRAIVHGRTHEQDAPAGDLGAPDEAQHLVGLAAEHAARDEVDPAAGHGWSSLEGRRYRWDCGVVGL